MKNSTGSLTPGAQYIYESPDGGDTVYAREFGKSERRLIGMSYRAKNTLEKIQEDKLWGNIRRAAEKNPALHHALEQCILIYELSKE